MKDKTSVFDKVDIINNYGVNLEKAIIYFSGTVDGHCNIALRQKIDMIEEYYTNELNKTLEEITLILSSPGGDATVILAILDLYDWLLAVKNIKVNVMVEGICYSAATFIVAKATGKRTASKSSRFLVHELQITSGEGTHTQTKALQKEINFLQDKLYEQYSELSLANQKNLSDAAIAKNIKEWEKRCTSETYLSAEEAKNFNLVDEII